jgi:hypothetical protein
VKDPHRNKVLHHFSTSFVGFRNAMNVQSLLRVVSFVRVVPNFADIVQGKREAQLLHFWKCTISASFISFSFCNETNCNSNNNLFKVSLTYGHAQKLLGSQVFDPIFWSCEQRRDQSRLLMRSQ